MHENVTNSTINPEQLPSNYRESSIMEGMPTIQEWKVAYSPENSYLDDLVRDLSATLKLDGYIPAANDTALAELLASKKILCGIEFDHPSVSYNNINNHNDNNNSN